MTAAKTPVAAGDEALLAMGVIEQFNLSNGSVITAIVVHALFNTASGWLGGLLGDALIRDKAYRKAY